MFYISLYGIIGALLKEKYMRKIISIILCLTLLFSLVACGSDSVVTETTAPAPTVAATATVAPTVTATPSTGETVYSMPFGDEVEWEVQYPESAEESFRVAMDSMIAGSTEQIDISFNYDECSYIRNYMNNYGFNRVIFSQLEYEITTVSETSNEFCYVTVAFTNIDVYNVIREGTEDWLAFMEYAATNDIEVDTTYMKEYMYECFISQIGNYTNDKITSTAQVLMKYDDDLGTWQIMMSDTTLIAMVGSEDALLEYLV